MLGYPVEDGRNDMLDDLVIARTGIFLHVPGDSLPFTLMDNVFKFLNSPVSPLEFSLEFVALGTKLSIGLVRFDFGGIELLEPGFDHRFNELRSGPKSEFFTLILSSFQLLVRGVGCDVARVTHLRPPTALRSRSGGYRFVPPP